MELSIAAVGTADDETVAALGAVDGKAVGAAVGAADGTAVGAADGATDGG